MRLRTVSAAGVFAAIPLLPLRAGPAFASDVCPIVRESCVSCHGPKKQMGGFRADVHDDYLRRSGSGPLVVPGDSASSRLVQLLSGAIRTKRSPEEHRLPPGQLAVVRAWIDSGAK